MYLKKIDTRYIVFHVGLFALLVCTSCSGTSVNAQNQDFIDREPAHNELGYYPADGQVVSVNPVYFVWLPERQGRATNKDWVIQYSREISFPADQTTEDVIKGITIHTPKKSVQPGTWFWRYKEYGTDNFSKIREFVISDDAVLFPFPDIDEKWMSEHIPNTRPRIYFSPEDVQEIRNNPDKYSDIIDPVVKAAEEFIEQNIPLMEEPLPWQMYADGRPLDWWGENYDVLLIYRDKGREIRPYARGMSYNALAYIYTGEKKFADEAKRWLMNFMDWKIGEEDVNTKDTSGRFMDAPASVYWPTELGLWIAEHSPRTFDWIYDTLTEEERNKCIEVLGRRVRQMNERHRSEPFEANPFGSHAGRLIGFALEGQIVLAHEDVDIDRANEPVWNLKAGIQEWFEYTLKIAWSIYPAWGHEDGGYYEGIHYWKRYMGHMLRVVIELDRIGVPLMQKPFFQNTGDFGLYAVYPHRPEQSFGDGFEWGPIGSSSGMEEDVMYTMASVMYNLSSLYENPYYRWASEQVGGRPSGPEAYQTRRKEIIARPPRDLPQSKGFLDVGWSAIHSNLASPEDNVLLLFQSSQYGSISHNHAIQNAFVLEAYSKPLAISSGYYQDYGSPHHSQWVWQSRAHNTILVDGIGQEPRSSASKGNILEHIENGEWTYVLGDASDAYFADPDNEYRFDLPSDFSTRKQILERAYRHVLYIRGDNEKNRLEPLIIIVDDLKVHDEYLSFLSAKNKFPEFQWLLHTHHAMNIDQENGEVAVQYDNAGMMVRFLGPQNIRLAQKTGWDQLPRDYPEGAPEQYHLTASSTGSYETKIITVLLPYRDEKSEEYGIIQLLDSTDGVTIQIGEKIVKIKDPYSLNDVKSVRSNSENVSIEKM